MKHLWKVEFAVKYSGLSAWLDDEIAHVIANGDGQKAIRKAERIVLKRSFDDAGTFRRAEKARLVGLTQMQEIDVS